MVFTCAPFSHNALQLGAPINPPGWNYRARVTAGSPRLNLPGRQQSAGKIAPWAWAHASPGGALRGAQPDFVELSRRAAAAWLVPAQLAAERPGARPGVISADAPSGRAARAGGLRGSRQRLGLRRSCAPFQVIVIGDFSVT